MSVEPLENFHCRHLCTHSCNEAGFLFLVPWKMLIFPCRALSGSCQKLKMGPMWPVIWGTGCKQTISDSPFPPLTFREYSVTVNLMQTVTLSPMIKIKYIERVFTIVTRATSNFLTMWKGCYFTCIGCSGQLSPCILYHLG